MDPDFRLAWRVDPLLRTLRHDPPAPLRRSVDLNGLDTADTQGRVDADVLILGWYGNETTGDQAILGGILRRLDPGRVWQTTSNPAVSQATLHAIGFPTVRLIDDDSRRDCRGVVAGGGGAHRRRADQGGADRGAVGRRLRRGGAAEQGADDLRLRRGAGQVAAQRRGGPPALRASPTWRPCGTVGRLTWPSGSGPTSRSRGSPPTPRWRSSTTRRTTCPPAAEGPVGVSFRHLPRDYHLTLNGRSAARVEADAIAAYATLINHIHEEHDRDVVLVPMQLDGPRNDRVAPVGACESGWPCRIEPTLLDYGGPHALTAALRGLSFMVGMRFHSVLMAWTAGVPTLGIDYDMHRGKVTGLLHQMGTPGLALPIARLSGPPPRRVLRRRPGRAGSDRPTPATATPGHAGARAAER